MKTPLPTKHSTRQSTPTGATSDEICSLFRPEYLEFTKQLAHIGRWFGEQMDNLPECKDYLRTVYVKIDDDISDVVYNIGELVSCEFQENVFFDPKNKK